MTNDDMYGAPAGRSHPERSHPERRRLERSRRDRVLGGVCAGIAHHLGVDSLLLRIAAVVLVLVSGGTAILAYLVAWMLIPPAVEEQRIPPPRPRSVAADRSARDAWTAAGDELRSLATGLRPVRSGSGHDAEAERRERSSAAAVDAAMTAMGDRLRDPEVRAGARRAAAGLSTAVGASVDQFGRRGRRHGPPTPGDALDS